MECLIEKTDECKKNPEKSSTTKVDEDITPCFSISAISLFKSVENSMTYIDVKVIWKRFLKPYERMQWR